MSTEVSFTVACEHRFQWLSIDAAALPTAAARYARTQTLREVFINRVTYGDHRLVQKVYILADWPKDICIIIATAACLEIDAGPERVA